MKSIWDRVVRDEQAGYPSIWPILRDLKGLLLHAIFVADQGDNAIGYAENLERNAVPGNFACLSAHITHFRKDLGAKGNAEGPGRGESELEGGRGFNCS